MSKVWMEAFPRWFIFGEDKERNTCDVNDGDGDIMIRLPRDKAEEIIAARDQFLDTLEKVAYQHQTSLQWNQVKDYGPEIYGGAAPSGPKFPPKHPKRIVLHPELLMAE